MKKTLFFFALLSATAQSATAQTSSLVKTYIRAEETLRVGTVSSQAVTGFNTTIPSVATNDKLPTTKAVKDYVNASFVPLGGTAGGDLNGTYPSPTVDGIQGRSVASTAPTTGQAYKWSGAQWVPGDVGNVFGSGATNNIPYWNDPSHIGYASGLDYYEPTGQFGVHGLGPDGEYFNVNGISRFQGVIRQWIGGGLYEITPSGPAGHQAITKDNVPAISWSDAGVRVGDLSSYEFDKAKLHIGIGGTNGNGEQIVPIKIEETPILTTYDASNSGSIEWFGGRLSIVKPDGIRDTFAYLSDGGSGGGIYGGSGDVPAATAAHVKGDFHVYRDSVAVIETINDKGFVYTSIHRDSLSGISAIKITSLRDIPFKTKIETEFNEAFIVKDLSANQYGITYFSEPTEAVNNPLSVPCTSQVAQIVSAYLPAISRTFVSTNGAGVAQIPHGIVGSIPSVAIGTIDGDGSFPLLITTQSIDATYVNFSIRGPSGVPCIGCNIVINWMAR